MSVRPFLLTPLLRVFRFVTFIILVLLSVSYNARYGVNKITCVVVILFSPLRTRALGAAKVDWVQSPDRGHADTPRVAPGGKPGRRLAR